MNILWVEDQLDDNRTYYDALSRRGSVIRLASSVHEALSLWAAERFDVVVIDLNIPLGVGDLVAGLRDTDLNGRHVIDLVARAGKLSVKIVCLTNFSEQVVGMELAELGVHVVPKATYLSEFTRLVYGD